VVSTRSGTALGLTGLTLSLMAACGGHSESAASCVGPEFTASPAVAAAGGPITVKGRFYLDGCNDTSNDGDEPPPTPPLRDVPLTLTPGDGPGVELGRFDATGELGMIAATVTLPAALRPGEATLQLGTQAIDVTISPPSG
jgi:hypothetical protein